MSAGEDVPPDPGFRDGERLPGRDPLPIAVSEEVGVPTTCGRGLAANAGLPARMADLIASLAENLEAHLPTIDQADPHGMVEHEAYLQLIHAHREIAIQLHAAAALMAAHRDLPMAPHHPEAFDDPRITRAFREYVRIEDDLARHLGHVLQLDRAMLSEMAPSTSPGESA